MSLLLVWITCVPCVSMTPIIGQSKGTQTGGSAAEASGPGEGQRLLSRAKRGWVWNQMFVLEEFSGPDPILVGRLHTDLDVGGKNIKYVLAGEGAGTIFAINELTGDIHAMKRLDREEKAEYTLTAQVVNADTDEPLEPPSEFIIKPSCPGCSCVGALGLIVVLFVTLRRHKNEPLIIKDDEDVRENIIRYDDEGGGEEDTEAFDIATLQNPDGINGYLPRKDIKPDLQFMPRAGQHSGPNGVDVDEFINVRLHEADNDPTAPPYDSIQIYGYEGRGSIAGSLSSLETASSDSDQNYDYLREWGPRFRRLGELYSPPS
uniref:Cadherin 8 n=1 Tax=Cyclopterus lumpus TaxID=8103 RepID=A0A8C2WC38_CYCLU